MCRDLGTSKWRVVPAVDSLANLKTAARRSDDGKNKTRFLRDCFARLQPTHFIGSQHNQRNCQTPTTMTMNTHGSDEKLVASTQDPITEIEKDLSAAREQANMIPQSRQMNADKNDGDTYTLYLVRHGEARHNVLEKEAKEKAEKEAEAEGLSPEETQERIKKAQAAVLEDPSLLDAPLSEAGKQEAEEARRSMQELQAKGFPAPEEVLVSPLQRALQTANLIFPECNDIHVRDELIERQTGRACDHRQSAEILARRGSFQRFSMVRLRTSSLMKCMLKELEDVQLETIADKEEEYKKIEERVEEKPMLRNRTKTLARFLMDSDHRVICAVTHKAFLRELERGTFGKEDATEFSNCEVRVYKVKCENYDLSSIERVA